MTTFKGIAAMDPKPQEPCEPPCTDPKELDDPVQVKWYCGLAVGPAKVTFVKSAKLLSGLDGT